MAVVVEDGLRRSEFPIETLGYVVGQQEVFCEKSAHGLVRSRMLPGMPSANRQSKA